MRGNLVVGLSKQDIELLDVFEGNVMYIFAENNPILIYKGLALPGVYTGESAGSYARTTRASQ